MARRQSRSGEGERQRQTIAEMMTERGAIDALLESVRSQRYRCYMCQEAMTLSMLVLNDRCRHSICRVCFAKVTVHAAGDGVVVDVPPSGHRARTREPLGLGRLYYYCMMCAGLERGETSLKPPSVLVTLSPGFTAAAPCDEPVADTSETGRGTTSFSPSSSPSPSQFVGYRVQVIDNFI